MHELSRPSPAFGGFQLPNPTTPARGVPDTAVLFYGPHLSAWTGTWRRDLAAVQAGQGEKLGAVAARRRGRFEGEQGLGW